MVSKSHRTKSWSFFGIVLSPRFKFTFKCGARNPLPPLADHDDYSIMVNTFSSRLFLVFCMQTLSNCRMVVVIIWVYNDVFTRVCLAAIKGVIISINPPSNPSIATSKEKEEEVGGGEGGRGGHLTMSPNGNNFQ